jgi:hypothetical protein
LDFAILFFSLILELLEFLGQNLGPSVCRKAKGELGVERWKPLIVAIFDFEFSQGFAGVTELWGLTMVLCLLEMWTALLKESIIMDFGNFCLLRIESVKCIMFPGMPVSPFRSLGM